ncbi:hypothetical protein EOA31_35605, partial [Mesorhizobium sp. M4B.F.Ca.ET.049.02.1.2]
MNPFYAEYIATAKALAAERGLDWDLVCDDHGKVSEHTRWNLTAIAGLMPPPINYLGQLGVDAPSFAKLNEIRMSMGQAAIAPGAMPEHWRDLYQAMIVEQLLIRKNKPKHACDSTLAIRQLAAAVEGTPPWAVTPEQVQQAYNAVLQSSPSGKGAMNFEMVVRLVLVGRKLVDRPSLARFCIPYPSEGSQAAQKLADNVRTRQNAHGGRKSLRRELAERKSASKLPDERAFWELVRIIFTEVPLSFSDAIRFAALKVQIIMGFRVGESVLLPLDWKRWREYLDADGRPAGDRGGFSRSLMIRHFAEKQQEDERAGGLSL